MDMMQLATQVLASKLGGNASQSDSSVENVIGNLLGASNGSGIDLGSLVSTLQNSGLGDIAQSWLGDGDNSDISRTQVESIFGSDKIQNAARELGTDQNDLLRGLQDMLPQVVDKSSSGGSLLDSIGGMGGLANLAGKFLK
ncbi:MAG: hypothetical protein ACI9SP_004047 [Arenicella sp.]|jgi:uncharacterized protein YidB (DUF937 family)